MKIKEVIIHNYKSISHDCMLTVDTKTTPLVGASETGKTNILKAINKFFSSETCDESNVCTFSEPISDDSYMVSVKFTLEDHDKEPISAIDQRLAKANEFTLRKQNNGHHVLEESGLGEKKAKEPQPPDKLKELHDKIRHDFEIVNIKFTKFYSSLPEATPDHQNAQRAFDKLTEYISSIGSPRPLRNEELDVLVVAAVSVEEFAAHLKVLANVPDALTAAIIKLNDSVIEATDLSYEIPATEETDTKPLLQLCPHALYIRDTDIQLLPDSVPISELEADSKKASIYKPLLQIANLSVENLRDPDPTKRERNFRRGAENINKFLKLWTQENLEAEFVVYQDNLLLHITGKEGHYGKLSDRSEGFRWFLSFCLAYKLPMDSTHSSILLLDEPGVHLHASAQKDLLELFESVADGCQIIYTTHSPFMINKNYPERIRGVFKEVRPGGTTVDNKPYRPTKGGYYEPIRTSIGLTLGNSLFIGGNNLIVEGIVDQILIAAFSRCLIRKEDKPFIDLQDICITPAGGAPNVPYFAYLCHNENMTSVVLLDNDRESDIAFSGIERDQVFPPEGIIRVREAISKSNKSIMELEDLIDQQFYHTAFLEAYKELPGVKFLQKLPKTYEAMLNESAKVTGQKVPPKGITTLYAELFKKHENEGWGRFDKVLVAKKIAQKLENGDLPKDGNKTISNFKKLFKRINDKF